MPHIATLSRKYTLSKPIPLSTTSEELISRFKKSLSKDDSNDLVLDKLSKIYLSFTSSLPVLTTDQLNSSKRSFLEAVQESNGISSENFKHLKQSRYSSFNLIDISDVAKEIYENIQADTGLNENNAPLQQFYVSVTDLDTTGATAEIPAAAYVLSEEDIKSELERIINLPKKEDRREEFNLFYETNENRHFDILDQLKNIKKETKDFLVQQRILAIIRSIPAKEELLIPTDENIRVFIAKMINSHEPESLDDRFTAFCIDNKEIIKEISEQLRFIANYPLGVLGVKESKNEFGITGMTKDFAKTLVPLLARLMRSKAFKST
jgi:hypothetical protein